MPRGVAKAKDGVEKKVVVKRDVVKKDVGKKDVVVKRSRRMRGGGSFKDYCITFLKETNSKYNADISIIKEGLTKLHKNIKSMKSGVKSIFVETALISELKRLEKDKTYENNIPNNLNFVDFQYGDVVYSLDKQIKFLNIMLKEIPTYQGNSGSFSEKIKDEDIDFLTKKIILNIIYKLFYHFKHICDKNTKVADIDLGEITKVEDVKQGKDKVEAELVDANAAKDKVKAELVDANAAKDKVKAELATLTAAKDKVDADLIAANAAKDKVKAELATANAAKDKVKAELVDANAAKDKVKAELATTQKQLKSNIITIDQKYFSSAFKKAELKYNEGLYDDAKEILTNISAIWEMLKNDEIKNIMEDNVTILKAKIDNQLTNSHGGGKRKINSSRTKRK